MTGTLSEETQGVIIMTIWNTMKKVYLAFLFLTLGAGLSQATTEDKSAPNTNTCLCILGFCEPGWVQYKNACYKKFSQSVSWPEAEAICLQYNSHLASIHSSEENDFVFVFMGSPTSPTSEAYWIGVHDTFEEGNYMNSDGSKAQFLPFGGGQPDNSGNEDFIGSWFIENGHVTWNDYPLVSYVYPFACKYYLGNRLSMRDEV